MVSPCRPLLERRHVTGTFDICSHSPAAITVGVSPAGGCLVVACVLDLAAALLLLRLAVVPVQEVDTGVLAARDAPLRRLAGDVSSVATLSVFAGTPASASTPMSCRECSCVTYACTLAG